MGFRIYLLENFKYTSTVRHRFKNYEIELQPLPPISTKSKVESQIKYEDLPTKEVIQKALEISDLQMRALILFISSSGTGRTETANLSINDFILATSDYHNSTNVYDVLGELNLQENVVPTWMIHRQITNKFYYAFNTPEATRAIVTFLQNRGRFLENSDSLFGLTPQYMGERFMKINDALGLGFVGSHRRFRPHMLRKGMQIS